MTVTAEFRSKHPHKTLWIDLAWDGDEPSALLGDLKAAGWVEHVPSLVAQHEATLSKPGTGLFQGWTPAERKANLAATRRILRRYGLARVPVRKLTLHDLL